MGEAKRRAERRRGARAAAQPPPPDTMTTGVTLLVPRPLMTQLRLRHGFVKEQYPSFDTFLCVLILEGVEVFDNDIEAFRAHVTGRSTPVAPPPVPVERLVVAPEEVSQAQMRALAAVSPAGAARREEERV